MDFILVDIADEKHGVSINAWKFIPSAARGPSVAGRLVCEGGSVQSASSDDHLRDVDKQIRAAALYHLRLSGSQIGLLSLDLGARALGSCNYLVAAGPVSLVAVSSICSTNLSGFVACSSTSVCES